MEPPAESSESPVAVYQDIHSWAGLLVFDVLALAYLAISRWLDVGVAELDVAAFCLLGISLLFALIGNRRIEVGPWGIRMYRRGVLRLQRPLDAFSHLQPLLSGLQVIVFRDGKRLWFAAIGQEGTQIVDFLAMHGQATRSLSMDSEKLELPVASLRFPEDQCIGCRSEPTTTVAFEASSGWDLIVVSLGVSRTLRAPACDDCRARRKRLGVAAYSVPVLTLLYFLFGPHLVPVGEGDPIKGVCIGVSVLSFVALTWWGAALCDRRVFGVWGFSLSRDTARVRLRVRDADLRQELARLAQAPGEGISAVGTEGSTPDF